VALTRARDRLILSGVHSKRTIPEAIHQELYRKAIHRGDKTGDAVMHSLLKKKPMPIAWIVYALPPLPGPAPAGAAQRVGDLPLVVRWIVAAAVVESEPAANPIRAIERSLRDLKPVDVPGEPDPDAKEALARTTQRASLPSPGHLATARGKIWATEFKSGRDFVHRIPRDAPDDGETDEAASPLVPDTGAADAAAAEGTTIHALLERLDFAGCDATNLAARVEDAAAGIDGIAPAACDVVLDGIARLLALPIGAALASAPAGALHREVAFSLRVPILEITQWMPDLRAEILTSDEWKDWVEADGDGASLRIRADRSPEAGAHWVLVQGRIDAAFRDADGGWTVLDWKSDRIPAEGPLLDERVALYRGQMEIYRRAVRDLFGSPVRAALFFLRPGMLRDV
jgi:ATP-dependent exoDNAse (exonuclease V) beta subunit